MGISGGIGVVNGVELVLNMPEGEFCEKAILLAEHGKGGILSGRGSEVCLVGRCKPEYAGKNQKTIMVYHLRYVPSMNGRDIVSFQERSGSGAFGKFVNRGTPAEYPNVVWAKYDPILREVGQ